MFTVDDWEFHQKNAIERLMADGDLMKNRSEQFKDEKKVCRLLVTQGTNERSLHYQVLVIERELKKSKFWLQSETN